MSNRPVPQVYRSIIDDVIANVRNDFDDMGVEDVVLAELKKSWENKVAASRVADFTRDEAMAEQAEQYPPVDPHEVERQERDRIAREARAKQQLKDKKPKREADDEEINSDLDDSDEELNSDDEDATRDVIFALFEKVHRTQNRWKVVLKDGIACVAGREYLFSKCHGEFEF